MMKRKLFTGIIAIGLISVVWGVTIFGGMGVVTADINNRHGDDLIAYWDFDEGSGDTVFDSSGHGNDGTVVGAGWVDGAVGSALEFVDTDIVVDIPASYDDSVSSDFSLETWLYWYGPHQETYTNVSTIFDGRSSHSGFYVRLEGDNGTLHLNRYMGSDHVHMYSVSPLPIGLWTHVAVTLNNSSQTMSFFINGVEDVSVPYVSPFLGTTSSAAIGNNHWAPGDGHWGPFNGVIDEVKVYNCSFSESEIRSHYEAYDINVTTIVDVSPFANTVYAGGSLSVTINITPLEPIAGFQFNLSFNSSLLQVSEVSEGKHFGSHDTFFNPGVIDNVNGTITVVYAVITTPGGNMPTPGDVAIINFTVLMAEGTAYLDLSDVIVGRPDGSHVPITIVNASVTVIYEPWDLNLDGRVNVLDLIFIGQHWGETGPPGWVPWDVNLDGFINVLDMILVGQHWTG